jgi:hypothetical protein
LNDINLINSSAKVIPETQEFSLIDNISERYIKDNINNRKVQFDDLKSLDESEIEHELSREDKIAH